MTKTTMNALNDATRTEQERQRKMILYNFNELKCALFLGARSRFAVFAGWWACARASTVPSRSPHHLIRIIYRTFWYGISYRARDYAIEALCQVVKSENEIWWQLKEWWHKSTTNEPTKQSTFI